MSKDIDEQLKLAPEAVNAVDWANRKICVTLQRYNMEKPESSYDQVRLFARKKFQQIKIAIFYVWSLFFLFESGWVGTLEILETFFSSWSQKWDFIRLYLQLQKFRSKNLN